MSNVSNEALWGKLSEMDEKLDKISKKRETETEEMPQISQITPSVSKEEIRSIVSEYVRPWGYQTILILQQTERI